MQGIAPDSVQNAITIFIECHINTIKSISALCSIVLLSACGGSDETDTETYIKFYNASPDSPSIYMTLDEDSDGI